MDVCLGLFDMPEGSTLTDAEAKQKGITVIDEQHCALNVSAPDGSCCLIQELSSDTFSSDSEED